MNLSLLKSPKLWIAVVVAIVGVLMANGMIVEGSTPAEIVGWVLSILGGAGAGHTAATNADPMA